MTEDEATLERFRVHELLGRYVDCLNHRDWDRFGDCWTEDGLFMVTIANDEAQPLNKIVTRTKPIGLRVVGRSAILTLLADYNRRRWLFQIPTGVFVQLNSSTTAQIRHTLTVNADQNLYIGICYDRAIKESDGVWRIRHRDYFPSYFENLNRSGEICRTLPDPNYVTLP